ncbi:MAG: GPW/gp25 family protein [Myxococcales bacterium]|nr:GPW/gp25 family protein [Myxococcales bacterium]
MSNNGAKPQFKSFLGTGWSFPPAFGPNGIVLAVDEEDIQQSLKILFTTHPGERFFHPKYGVDLRALLFEPLTTTMTTLVQDNIRTAVLLYEPRIRILSLKLDTSTQFEGFLAIDLAYEIRATNSRYNLVYPFSVSDANEVRTYFGSGRGVS